MVEKILESHLVQGRLTAGEEIGIRIDQTLTQDATGTMAYLQFEALGIGQARTELSVSYVDHNTVQQGFENADDHRYLQSAAAKFGAYFSRPGNGICHQVHLERFGVPGKTLLGSDSHTPTGGGIGMFAVGAGGLEVALAMSGAPFYLTAPRVVRINLNGSLPDWVAAKDIILHILALLSSKGNVGQVIEYGGSSLDRLSVPERATITNMGAETGVTTSLFPSDRVTHAWLKAQQRESDWQELLADSGARYDRVIDIDLATLEPLAAAPHNPANIKPVRELTGTAVNQVAIGSCTNSSYADLMLVANILRGKRINPGVSLIIAPGSKQVLEMITANGALNDLIAAGARIAEAACGFCIGAGHAPASGSISLRTSNRNFKGRSGTADADIYLVSPATAAAAALAGAFRDPRDLGTAPRIAPPESYPVNDSLIITPPADAAAITLQRGPNIGPPPDAPELPDEFTGEVALKVGDLTTTDDIMPAGPRLKFRSNIPHYAQFVFEGIDPSFPQRAKSLRDNGKAVYIVGGLSYGQGSSREHAAICPMFLGVRAVLARSFERIHAANLVNFGIIPIIIDAALYQQLEQGSDVTITTIHTTLKQQANTISLSCGGSITTGQLHLQPRQYAILLAGGSLRHQRAGT